MAGMGKRMRPHTLTIPKPLIPLAGKPIVQWLAEDIKAVCNEKIENIGFIIGNFGHETEQMLLKVAERLGAKGHIFYQEEALGTAHAIFCAEKLLNGKVVVAFADTLFKADFKMDTENESVIWVQKVEDPKAFGVVQLDQNNRIVNFVEKPQTFVSNLAIIGIYFFKNGSNLHREIKYLLDNKIMTKGEFQLTDALETLKNKGMQFFPGQVTEWLDCGNKNATIYTNARMLNFKYPNSSIASSAVIQNTTIIHPCFIDANAHIEDCVIGPYVSIGSNSKLDNCIIKNSIIGSNTHLQNQLLSNSMIGNHTIIKSKQKDLSIGDYNHIEI